MASTVKDPARVNYHARRMDFTGHDAFCLNLDPALRENHSVKAPRDDHAVSFDLSFHFCAFPEDHGLFGDDVAAHIAVNTKRAGELQCAFEGHTLVNKAGPLFAHAIL